MRYSIRTLGLLAIFMTASLVAALAQEVKVYVSSKAGDRLAAKPALHFEKAAAGKAVKVDLNDAVTFQEMDGFGASFLEAGLICINALEPTEQEKVLAALFDPERGAGYTAMKTVLAGTDFMSAGPWYTYDDTPGDVKMKNFSIARDLGPNGQITFIKRARKYGKFVLQAPMDYPPDWMITNLQDRKKQDVDTKYFDALARYYLRYLQEYEKNGVFIDYLSLFNEPGIYTKIPYTKIRDLLENHVGPLFEREGVRTRLCFAEAEDRESAANNFPTVLDDPAASKYVAVLMYHGYRLKSSRPIEEVRRRYPNLPLWQTEVCHAYDSGTPHSMTLPRLDFDDGDFWGNLIVSDLEAGASAWLYWNMILDEKGGPWLTSEVHEDGDPNVQHPVVVINRETKQVTYTGLYYYLAHFSKFVRPGAVRIEAKGGAQKIRCLGFKTPEGGFVAQLLNSRSEPAEVQLNWHGQAVRVSLPALSISTCLWKSE